MIKTIIIYQSYYGSVKECAESLKTKLKGDVILHNLNTPIKSIEDYDRVIIGCSIRADGIPKKVKKVIETYNDSILRKRFGLYLCSLTPPDKAYHYFDKNFPQKILKHATVKGLFGGALYYEKMNFFMKFLMKKITKKKNSERNIVEENIDKFVELFETYE